MLVVVTVFRFAQVMCGWGRKQEPAGWVVGPRCLLFRAGGRGSIYTTASTVFWHRQLPNRKV